MDAIRKKMQSLKEKFNKKLNDKNEVMILRLMRLVLEVGLT